MQRHGCPRRFGDGDRAGPGPGGQRPPGRACPRPGHFDLVGLPVPPPLAPLAAAGGAPPAALPFGLPFALSVAVAVAFAMVAPAPLSRGACAPTIVRIPGALGRGGLRLSPSPVVELVEPRVGPILRVGPPVRRAPPSGPRGVSRADAPDLPEHPQQLRQFVEPDRRAL